MKHFKLIACIVLQILVTAILVGAFLGLPYALTICKIQPGFSITFGVVILLSFVFGRFFCQALCPLGAIQDLIALVFHPKTKVRRVCSRLPCSKANRIVRSIVLLVAFCGAMFGMLAFFDPCGIVGRFVSLFVADPPPSANFRVLAIGLFAFVVISAAVGRGRFWCNWICPMGTVFDLIARFAYLKDRPSPRCANCRACFPKTDEKKFASAASGEGLTRRETLRGIAAVAVAEKLTDGGLAEVTKSAVPTRATPILPPGALWGAQRFAVTCVGCQLCVAHCPSKCLKPISWSGQVGLVFQEGYCLRDCTKCAEVCPMGAMKKLSVLEKRNTHFGIAEWKSDRCLRATGEKCEACVRKCPAKALHLIGNNITVDADACVGCGACEHVCAARPEPAIVVNGLFRQRLTEPMSEKDLFAEIQENLKAAYSLVIVRDGVIRWRVSGSGIASTLKMLEAGRLAKATVYDRVVGRAAAAIFIQGGVKKVWARVMAEDAEVLLRRYGVEVEAETFVKGILNQDRTDRCPLEKATDRAKDPKKIVEILSAF